MKQSQNDDNIVKSKQIECIIFTHFSQIIGFSREKIPNCSILQFSQNGQKKAWGRIPLYVYIENFKYLLLFNHWPDCIDIWQELSLGDPIASF